MWRTLAYNKGVIRAIILRRNFSTNETSIISKVSLYVPNSSLKFKFPKLETIQKKWPIPAGEIKKLEALGSKVHESIIYEISELKNSGNNVDNIKWEFNKEFELQKINQMQLTLELQQGFNKTLAPLNSKNPYYLYLGWMVEYGEKNVEEIPSLWNRIVRFSDNIQLKAYVNDLDGIEISSEKLLSSRVYPIDGSVEWNRFPSIIVRNVKDISNTTSISKLGEKIQQGIIEELNNLDISTEFLTKINSKSEMKLQMSYMNKEGIMTRKDLKGNKKLYLYWGIAAMEAPKLILQICVEEIGDIYDIETLEMAIGNIIDISVSDKRKEDEEEYLKRKQLKDQKLLAAKELRDEQKIKEDQEKVKLDQLSKKKEKLKQTQLKLEKIKLEKVERIKKKAEKRLETVATLKQDKGERRKRKIEQLEAEIESTKKEKLESIRILHNLQKKLEIERDSKLISQTTTLAKDEQIVVKGPRLAIQDESQTHYEISLSLKGKKHSFLFPKLQLKVKREELLSVVNFVKMYGKFGRSVTVSTLSPIVFLQKYRLKNHLDRGVIYKEFKEELIRQDIDKIIMIMEWKAGEATNRVEIINPLYLYMGLAEQIDSKKVTALIYSILVRSKDEKLQFKPNDSTSISFEHENRQALIDINSSLNGNHSLNTSIFSPYNTPILLAMNGQVLRLPSLPTTIANTKYKNLAAHVLQNPSTTATGGPDDIATVLDKLGDRLLWTISFEYLRTKAKNGTPMMSLLNSNGVLGHLLHLYDFPRMLLGTNFETWQRGENVRELELLGDIFERFVGLSTLEDPEATKKWLHGVFDVFSQAIDIERYVREIEKANEQSPVNSRFLYVPKVVYTIEGIQQVLRRHVLAASALENR
ncbi:hypothetical protein CAAN1_27S00650 [[Candida] anglica]|uniref:Uncharacterized protein n=1 Tax=[Candida] anglica TaxID=148631 RepID=A0ABP0E7P8_9ASCO